MRRSFFLSGATVQKVSAAEGLLALRVRLPGATWVVVLDAGGAGALPLAEFKDLWVSPGPPSSTVLGLRRRLEGARLLGVRGTGLELRAGEHPVVLTMGRAGPTLVTGAQPDVAPATEAEAPANGELDVDQGEASDPEVSEPGASELAEQRRAWHERGQKTLARFSQSSSDARRIALTRALTRARQKLVRRRDAIRGDLARIDEAAAKSVEASAFVAAASAAPRGARSLRIPDWSTGEETFREMLLDPARSAREQLDAIFKKARRLKQARPVIERRLGDTEATLARLDALANAVPDAPDAPALEAFAVEARRAAPMDFVLASSTEGRAPAEPRKGGRPAPRRPYRTFEGHGGAAILVGRGAADNDALSFHVAKPTDLWLHAKGQTGSHVIVPLPRGKTCPGDLLVDAAHLAAHFSDARGETLVEIQYTPRRYLRKPKGSAPGFVLVDREKVLAVRIEASRLERLLASERNDP